MLIVGAGVVAREDRDLLLKKLHAIADSCGIVKEGWNGAPMIP